MRAGEVPEVAVHAPVRHQPDQVEGATPLPQPLNRSIEPETIAEVPVRDRTVDPRDVLIDDAPAAEIQVPDLGVAHLSVRQPHVRTGAREPGAWEFVVQRAKARHVCELDRVAGVGLPDEVGVAPPVENDQEDATHGGSVCGSGPAEAGRLGM